MITLGVVAELLEDCVGAVSSMMADLAASGRRRRRLQNTVLTAPSNFRSPAVATANHCLLLRQSSLQVSILPNQVISPSRSIASMGTTTSQATVSQKRTCMCSPTTHLGSFRCSLHKNYDGSPTRRAVPYQSNGLHSRRSAMTNSLVRIGTVEGDLVKCSEIERPENKGLSAALSFVEAAKKEIDSYSKGGPIGFADLIQLAAQSAVKVTFLAAAIRKCGRNVEKGSLLYTAYGSTGQWGQFGKIFGRTDADEPDPKGRIPQWDKATVQEMRDKFSAVGLGPRQLAVLSAFLGPDKSTTESLLATDPEVAPWVQKYQRS
ncbi:hypothetical protein Droror1_Dr00009393 [Drosera rotundifolia]